MLAEKPVDIHKFNSSRVDHGEYDPNTKILILEFKNNHARYQYENVSAQTWAAMKRATSAGQYISRILNNYPYRRL